ncbi:MAG: hypothetical protein ACTMIR_01970 [Cellulomonadaceae bacterium]
MAAYRTHLDKVVLVDQLVSRVPWARLDREVSDGLNFPPESGIFQPSPVGWLRHSEWLHEKVWTAHGVDASVYAEITHP